MTLEEKYKQPTEVSDVMMVFPGSLGELIPPFDEIPKAYEGRRYFEGLQSRWFAKGLDPDDCPPIREGIDEAKAWRHLAAIQRSFEPKHEHKVAAVGWLMSLWFELPDEEER